MKKLKTNKKIVKGLVRMRAHNRRRFKKFNRIMYYFYLMMAVVLTLAVLFFADTIFHSKEPLNNKLIKISISENTSGKEIAKILYLNGVIENISSFNMTIKLLNLDSSLKAGIYYFKPSMINYEIINSLREGRLMKGPVKLVVPEGFSIYRIARALEKNSIEIEGSFDALGEKGITDELCERYPFLSNAKTKSLEGYLFPDTYMVFKRINVETLVHLMLNRFEEIVIPAYNISSFKNKYSLHDILTLASIIEKEAEVDRERPIIASVFYNRLENGMMLRADPTVKYVLENPTKILYYKDLRIKSPYNTYLNTGLPPGPICNPGLKSILAALNPVKTNYLYFVSNGKGGTHTFSANWDGHAKAVQRYRTSRSLPLDR